MLVIFSIFLDLSSALGPAPTQKSGAEGHRPQCWRMIIFFIYRKYVYYFPKLSVLFQALTCAKPHSPAWWRATFFPCFCLFLIFHLCPAFLPVRSYLLHSFFSILTTILVIPRVPRSPSEFVWESEDLNMSLSHSLI